MFLHIIKEGIDILLIFGLTIFHQTLLDEQIKGVMPIFSLFGNRAELLPNNKTIFIMEFPKPPIFCIFYWPS
jgi:hypothetical protein